MPHFIRMLIYDYSSLVTRTHPRTRHVLCIALGMCIEGEAVACGMSPDGSKLQIFDGGKDGICAGLLRYRICLYGEGGPVRWEVELNQKSKLAQVTVNSCHQVGFSASHRC